MATDKFPHLAAEGGTYVTGGSPDPKVTLSGVEASLLSLAVRTFAAAAGDSNTDFDDTDSCQIAVVTDKDNWLVMSRAVWNDDTTDYFDLSGATTLAAKGTVSNSDTVTVWAQFPTRSDRLFIPIPLFSIWESDGSNATAITGATTPSRDMANGDTDSGIVLTWAASNSDAIIFQTPLPANLDASEDVVIHIRAKSGGATDTPVFDADSYFDEGDTKVEDASGAVSASYSDVTITIAAADIPDSARTLTVELTPGSHTTDTLVLSAIRVEYSGYIV